jgi:hypothetical protein
MKQATDEMHLRISADDAGLLMVALWQRTHDAANPSDYEHLRSRLHQQLCVQGYAADAEPRHEVSQ